MTSWFATAPEAAPIINGVPMAGSVYLYRGRTVTDETPRQNAEDIITLMRPHNERGRGCWR